MGNADLRDLAVLEAVPFDDLSGSVVAIDAHNWLYRYLTTTVRWTNEDIYTTTDGDEVANLVGVVQGLPKFFEHDITPVFVFDGSVVSLKDDEVAERRAGREKREEKLETAREEGDELSVSRWVWDSSRATASLSPSSRAVSSSSSRFSRASRRSATSSSFRLTTDPSKTNTGVMSCSKNFGSPWTIPTRLATSSPSVVV